MSDGNGEETAPREPPWLVMARESRETVEAALRRRDLAPRVRERLEMVKGVALGQSVTDVARWSGRTERTVERWLTAYVDGGAAALADGRVVVLTELLWAPCVRSRCSAEATAPSPPPRPRVQDRSSSPLDALRALLSRVGSHGHRS